MIAMDREDAAASRFACGGRDRALFEAGIKMGTIYHQFVGSPVNAASAPGLERAMSEAVLAQPYVAGARISIDGSRLPPSGDEYSYASLTGDMIDAVVTVEIGGFRVVAEMRYDRELDYPLMYVSSVGASDAQKDATENQRVP